MSDKSFGDHMSRNVVKNPLLSTSVVGLSLHDLSSNAVLLPVAQTPVLVSSQDPQPPQATPQPRQSGDNPTTPHKLPHIPQTTHQTSKADDFDVSEYFARLQGTRYVSAPLNVNTELEKSALESAEENLEEINLNEQTVQQSLTSDIAQNFSQLPQVLPQVASAVFSSFSNMLSYKSREVTPEVETRADGYREVDFQSPGFGLRQEAKSEPAPPPPKDGAGSTQHTFRIASKKKYAQIPGLSSGETLPMNQYSQPPQTQTSTPFYVPSFEPGQPNPPAQIPGYDLRQPPPPTSFAVPGFQFGQTSQTISQVRSFIPGQSAQPGFGSGQFQQPPPMSQTGHFTQGDRVVTAATGQIEVDFNRTAQENLLGKVISEKSCTTIGTVPDSAEIIASNTQNTIKEIDSKNSVSNAFQFTQTTGNAPVENILTLNPQNFPPANPSLTIPALTPSHQISNPNVALVTSKNQPQHSSSFSNVPGAQGTPVIPPPTMFSNQRKDSKTDVGKTILPPSVARRLAGNQPLIKQPVNQTTFQANILVPVPISDQATQDSFAAVSNSSVLGQNSVPTGFCAPPMSGANVLTQVRPIGVPLASNTPIFGQSIPSNFAPPSSALANPPPTFAATSTLLTQNVSSVPPPPMFLNPTSLATEPVKSTPMENMFAPPNAAVSLPSSASNVTAPPTQMFNPATFATNQPYQKTVQNVLEPPKLTFDPIAFTTNLPEPPKVVPEPPKISTGNTNFRLSKKRPQYYSGPIEGVGSISNNVKPIIPQAEMPGTYQGALFEPAKPPEVPTLDTNQAFIPPAASLEVNTVPFNLNKPVETNMASNCGYSISDPQQNVIGDQINTVFDFSRQTTESFDEPKQESKGFGLIGSLKSKLSALDINKIQNTVTTFFDPAYNDAVKAEPDSCSQNSLICGQTGQNYGPPGQEYGQTGQDNKFGQSSHSNYRQHDQQTNLEIFIPNIQQMPEQAFNQQCYDSTYNQCQSSNTSVHGLSTNNQYFPDHYNYYQYPAQNPTDQQSYYTVHPTNPYVHQQSAQNPLTAEQIQENNTANVYNSNVYNFNQMSEDQTSKDFFNNQHQSNVNQYGADQVKNMTKVQADAQVVTDKLLQSQTVGYQGSVPQAVRESDTASLRVGENMPSESQIKECFASKSQSADTGPSAFTQESTNVSNVTGDFGSGQEDDECNKIILRDSPKHKAEVFPTENEESNSYTPTVSKEDEPKIDISKANLFGLSSSLADNYKDVEEKLDDLTSKGPSAMKLDEKNVSFFFDNVDRKEPNERKSEEDMTDLKMCETCREVNSPDLSQTDLTSQLIQNITAPIQLSNPVEVPLTESQPPLLGNIQFSTNPSTEIQLVTEESIKAIQVHLATDLLDRKDIEKFDQRHEIPEISNYGWCDSQTAAVDHENTLKDPNIQNLNAIEDFTFHTDPNAIGFMSNNSLFFDDIPNNASDEIKAEFKNAHEEPILLSRQMSIPSAPAEEDLDYPRFDLSGGLDVQLIEQDAKRDFPVFEEFVIEPSETDDDKVKEKERSGSEEEVNETDTFTNRVERFKKLEDSVEPAGSNVLFEMQTSTSPSITIASYFDTGNYAAETHYRNSLTSPSSINAMNLGAQNQNVSILPPIIPPTKVDNPQDVYRPLKPLVDDGIYKIPDVGTQTTIVTTTATTDVCSYTTTESAFKPGFCLPERSFIPQPSTKETPPSVDPFTKQSAPQENLFEPAKPAQTSAEVIQVNTHQEIPQRSSVGPNLPDPMNFFGKENSEKNNEDANTNRLASYFAAPPKTSDNTKSFFELSQGQDHLKDKMPNKWETTQSYKSFFEENAAGVEAYEQDFTDTDLRQKQDNPRQQRQSLGRDENESSDQHQNWESTQSFKSYFDTEDDAATANRDVNKNKTLYAMTQSQNVTYTPEQYRANLQLIKDLTSANNFQPTDDQVVKTVNYNSVIYPNRPYNTDLSTGEPKPKNSDDKFPNEKIDSVFLKTNAEETTAPDDSKLVMLVNKCKLCCNVNSDRVVVLKDADLTDTKVRKSMVNESSEGKNGNMSPEKNSEGVPSVPLPEQSSFGLKYEDNKDDSGATLTDNRTSTEYIPVKHHWFYRVDAEGKSIWRGFSVTDNTALEEAFASPDLDESTVVPTDGGRFDVNVVGRLRVAVYWADRPTNVRRCSWFYKGNMDARYVPYTEGVAEKLEEEYRHGVTTGEWHRRLVLPNNEAVVMHGPAVMVHFLQSTAADAWSGGAQSTMRPRVVRRGYDESEIEDPEPSSIDHLLIFCHGVGSACDMRFRSVEEVVDDFRATSLQLIQGHYRSSYDEGIVGRVEVLPISWHSTLHSGEGGVDRRLARITLDSIPRLRSFTNDTVLDVLFYTSPVFCQTIIDEVCKELNRVYSLFKQRNPSFEGGVSLGGHSLGSVILYDLLCHQPAKAPEAAGTTNKAEKMVTGSAGTGQPTVRYPVLNFTPQALYALGSPIAIFECIRGVDCLGEQFALPNCKNFFNIFHPYDPIAYRIEPLINPQLKNVSPFLIPHHKGRKRMHLELKETVARVGADLKQKLLESIRTTWSSMWRAQPPAAELEKVVEEELEKGALADDAEPKEEQHLDLDTKELLGQLNAGRRVDYVLQEAPFEMINEYLFAMSSHVCYWESEDTMLLMLREIYDGLGVQPDCCLPQQTLAVQRTRTLGNNEDILANAEMASTSGIRLEKS